MHTVSDSESHGPGRVPKILFFLHKTELLIKTKLMQIFVFGFQRKRVKSYKKKWGKFDFRISSWKSLTRPYVFDVVFPIFHFPNLCLKKLAWFGKHIFELVNFQCENVQKCDFLIFDGKSLTRPYVFDVVFHVCAIFQFVVQQIVCFFSRVNFETNWIFGADAVFKFKHFGIKKLRIQEFRPKIVGTSLCFPRCFADS